MRPVRIFGILLISASMAIVAIALLLPYSTWFESFAFMLTLAGFILATGDFAESSRPHDILS